MQQYNLNDIQAFIQVAESGSFKKAAENLRISTAAVSRRISSLECSLEVKLLNRTTRQVHLTESGEQYFSQVHTIFLALQEAEENLHQNKQVIKGNLRLAAPLSFGIQCIAPLLPDFLKLYPELDVHLQLEDHQTDLYSSGIDLAIRIGDLKDSSLIATRITDITKVYCASPEYLNKHGEPTHPSQLQDHQLLHYSLINSKEEWYSDDYADSIVHSWRWRLSVNNGEALKEAAIQGLGIAMLPNFIVEDALNKGQLKSIMKAFSRDQFGLYAVRPSRRFTPAKIQILIDYFKHRLGN